ncbi:hypothetical protein D3C73_1457770 [compost metagenome]
MSFGTLAAGVNQLFLLASSVYFSKSSLPRIVANHLNGQTRVKEPLADPMSHSALFRFFEFFSSPVNSFWPSFTM